MGELVLQALYDDALVGREVCLGAEQLMFMARLMAAVLSHPPLTPATLDHFSFDNVCTDSRIEKEFGISRRELREPLRQHGL